MKMETEAQADAQRKCEPVLIEAQAEMEGPGGYLGQFLLGMCRWPLRTPTPL